MAAPLILGRLCVSLSWLQALSFWAVSESGKHSAELCSPLRRDSPLPCLHPQPSPSPSPSQALPLTQLLVQGHTQSHTHTHSDVIDTQRLGQEETRRGTLPAHRHTQTSWVRSAIPGETSEIRNRRMLLGGHPLGDMGPHAKETHMGTETGPQCVGTHRGASRPGLESTTHHVTLQVTGLPEPWFVHLEEWE